MDSNQIDYQTLDLSSFLREYGESLATRLKVIAHKKGVQTRYVFADLMDDAEELLKAQLTSLKVDTNVLIWERFGGEQLSTGKRDNYTTMPQGSVAVVHKPSKDAKEVKSKTVDQCRLAVLKVIALMLQDQLDYDSELVKASIRFDIDGQSGDAITGLPGGWVGYGFSYQILAPLDLTLNDDDLV